MIAALQKRDDPKLTRSQEIALIGALTSAFLAIRNGAQSNLAASITQDFDNTLGGFLGINSQNFPGVYNAFPDLDPVHVTESLLCAGSNAGRFISDQQRETSCSCQLPRRLRSNARNSPRYTPHLSKRTVEWGWTIIPGDPTTNTEPTVAQVLDGIINNNLGFMYTRLLRYNGGENGPDGIVEMAWRIPAGNAGDPYRSFAGDQYVVLHAHTNHLFVPNEGGPRYPGVYQVNVFHAQHFDVGTNRVDAFTNDDTARQDVLLCQFDDTVGDYEYWYVGAPEQPCEADIGTRLGPHLRNQGILTGTTYNFVPGGNAAPDDQGYVNPNWNAIFHGESISFLPNGQEYIPPNNLP